MGHVNYRAAAVAFLTEYAVSMDIGLQVYPGRPRTVRPPTGFVDGINETYNAFTDRHYQGNIQVRVIVLWGLFDSLDAVTQKDEFIDGLAVWAYSHPHEAGGNTLIWLAEVQDLPDYVPEWLPPEQQKTYYATEVTLGGFETN